MLVNMMRTNQRWLMIVVCSLTIISFLWFFSNRTQVGSMASNKAGSMYGETFTVTDLERTKREIETAADLGLSNLLAPEMLERRDLNGTEINHLVVIHQVREFGLYPTDDEVVDAEKKLPVFAGANGEFDSTKYATFISDKLSPRGFSETQLAELVRRNLQFGKLRDIVTGPVVFSPLEARTIYEQSQTKTDASVVRFPIADLAAGIQPTDAEIKKYFDEQSAAHGLQEPAKRQVAYIRFGLSEAQQKLAGKERMDALQPLADAAAGFLEKLVDIKDKDGFAKLAADQKLTVKTTVDFEQDQHTGFDEANIPQFTVSAFQLSAHDPDSDVPLQTADAFYVLHLAKITPERPLTLEEAKTKIVAALKDERARTALSAKAEETRTRIADALKAGRTFADAVTAAGSTAQDVAPFTMMQPPQGQPDGSELAAAAQELGTGELSKFVPTPAGGLLVYVRGREPIDEQKFAQESPRLLENVSENKRRLFFYEWLKASRAAAHVQLTSAMLAGQEG